MQPTAGRPDYDQPLKRLLLRAHDGFLQLVAPGLTWRGELSPELPAASRRADLVWEVERPDGQRGILHIELQTKPDPEIGQRMAEYGLRLWLRDRLPVRSLVVLLRQTETLTQQSPFIIEWMGEERLRYVFDVIRLWEVAAERVLETPYYDLWPLAGLMADVTAESTVAVAERIAVAPLPAPVREDLTNVLVLLAGLRIPTRMLAQAMRRKHMPVDMRELWEESSLKDALAMLAREDAMRESIRLVLEARFGPVDAAVVEALKPLDEDALTELTRHAATDTLEEFRGRIGLQ